MCVKDSIESELFREFLQCQYGKMAVFNIKLSQAKLPPQGCIVADSGKSDHGRT